MFIDELEQLSERQKQLEGEIEANATPDQRPALLHSGLGRVYREKVAQLTGAFEDETLRAEAFERIRALIEGLALTPGGGALALHLRGDLASMLELCACGETQKAPDAVANEALQIKLVAGTGFDRCRTRFHINRTGIVAPQERLALAEHRERKDRE